MPNKRKLRLLVIGITVVLLLLGVAGVIYNITAKKTTTPAASPNVGFLERRQQIIDYFAKSSLNTTQTGNGPHRIGRMGFWGAEANFLQGNDTKALAYVKAALKDATSEGTNAGFSMWPGIDCYLRWSSKFPQELKDQFKSVYTSFTGYKGGVTPNQKFMLATARYLATQVWGADAFTKATEWGAIDPTGGMYIQSLIDVVPFEGLIESDSRIYSVFTFAPMTSIADLSTNRTLAQHAELAVEWTITRASSAWLSGHWAVSAARTFPTDPQTEYISGEFPYWLFFGGSQPADFLDSAPSVIFCRSGYEVSDIFEKIANDRTKAYTTTMFNYRHERSEVGNIGHYKTVFMNKNNYALYSQIENKVEKNPDNTYKLAVKNTATLYDPHQMQRWGIEWNDPKTGNSSMFFVTNPYDPDYAYVGTTNFEEVVQHDGSLIAVYNIPATSTKPDWNHAGKEMPNFQILWGSIPAGYLASIDNSGTEGRIFLYYNNVMISLYISKVYSWNGKPTFSFPVNQAGLALETALPDEYTGATPMEKLQSFKNDIIAKSVVDSKGVTNPAPTMLYTDRKGVKLEITFGGTRKINRTAVDLSHWPLLESPWVHQAMGGPLTVSYGNASRTYDFVKWTSNIRNK